MQDGTPLYTPTTKDEALKILQMGGKLAGESAMTAVAKANLDKTRQLAQMTDTQLAQNITNGTVSSRELETLNKLNPALVSKAQEMSRKSVITDVANTIQVANDAIVKGEEATIQNKSLTNLLNKVAELDANAETYGDIKARVYANYPDMENARTEIVTAQTQLRQAQRAKRELFDDYKKKNSSLPISMIMAGYSALSRGLDDQIYEINDSLNQNVALYNSYLDEAKSEIDWEIGKQAKDEARLFQMFGITRAEEVRSEDIQREDKRIQDQIDLEQIRYDRDIAREDTLSARAREQKLSDLKEERDYALSTGLLGLGIDPTGMTTEELRANYALASKNALDKEEAYKNASILREETITNEDGSTSTRWINPLTGREVTPQETF